MQREFYPRQMSIARALQYRAGALARPMDELDAALRETAPGRQRIAPGAAVVHWFKMDLRVSDNRALHLAAARAQAARVPLLCVYLVSPQDFEAHLRAPARVDFMLRTLAVLRADLARLDVPLHVESVARRRHVPARLLDLAQAWRARHVFANVEYEVDELRRETALVRAGAARGVAFEAVHDACVVPPGRLASQQGSQYAVYSPWFRAWLAYCHRNPDALELLGPPGKNPPSARTEFGHLFDAPIPDAPESKRLSDEEKLRYSALWPAGEHVAQARLQKFLLEKVGQYKDTRNLPARNSTAMLSVHLAAGTLSARTAVRRAKDINTTKGIDTGNPGITGWISEVAWRDFYKHVLVGWPYVW